MREVVSEVAGWSVAESWSPSCEGRSLVHTPRLALMSWCPSSPLSPPMTLPPAWAVSHGYQKQQSKAAIWAGQKTAGEDRPHRNTRAIHFRCAFDYYVCTCPLSAAAAANDDDDEVSVCPAGGVPSWAACPTSPGG